MTAGSLSHVLYLDREDYRDLHASLVQWSERDGEPIPPFSLAKESELDSLVKTPQAQFFGNEAYATIEEKAAIIFYTNNKKQIFLNGNKRMSTLSLIVFLDLNGKKLRVTPDELTQKALWLAKTNSLDFPQIKTELVEWIRAHIADAPAPDPWP